MKILSRPKKNAEEYGKWAVNPYVGCTGGCLYCYLRKGPSGKYLGQDHPVLKKGVVNWEHAYHMAMTEIIEHKDEIIRDGGLFFTFTSDPCLPETRRLTFRIVSACIGNKATPKEQVIPVVLLTKNADFCAWGPPTPDSCGMMIPPYDWVSNIGMYDPEILRDRLAIGWTLTGHDELEPHASKNAERLLVMKHLSNKGYLTWASIEPVIDFRRSSRMIQQALDAGCRHFKIGLMTRGTKVCRRGFTLGGTTFEPYDPARCLAFVQDVMQQTRDRATVYWKQSFRDFLRPGGSKRPKAERIGGTGKHRLFSDDEPMEQREQNGACSDYAESRQRSAESQLHKIFDDYPNAVGKDWSFFKVKSE